jgi:AcrR family transcriptional regulator
MLKAQAAMSYTDEIAAKSHPPMNKPTRPAPSDRPSRRIQDPEGVKRNILAVATQEFARNGYSGARIDEIAARTRTSKRMIYYYFGDKEHLYIAVLERAYGAIRAMEETLDLDAMPPSEALAELVGRTFDYQDAHPDLIRLVMSENINDAVYLKRSNTVQSVNNTVIDTLQNLIERGVQTGTFRKGLDPIDLHMTISALCVFNVANRATFAHNFKTDMSSAKALARRRAQVIETVLRYANV